MRIIGITCPTADGSLQTVLVRSSVSLQNASVRKILPWFFSQAIPLFDILTESCIVIRLQTEIDPFRHLRLRKSPPFDGKGFNLQRSERHEGFVCIDQWLSIPIEDFNQLCPGLFYGTAKFPNLNILLSQRRFRQHVVNSSKLWAIIYDCLFCRQFNERQLTEGDFKQDMRRKYLATQQTDFRSEIAELEERIEMSNEYSKLKNSLQQMIVSLHSHQVQRFNEDVKQLMRMLREVVYEKEQLLAVRALYDHESSMVATKDITAASITVRKNELENLLAFCQEELFEARANLELRKTFEALLEEVKTHINEMQDIVDQVNSIRFWDFELESVRSSIENNNSLLLLSKISDATDRKIYASNLQILKHSKKLSLISALGDVKQMKKEIKAFIDQLQAFEDLCNVSLASNDSHQCELLEQLQRTIVKMVETTNAITTYETKIAELQEQIWHNHLQMSHNVPFTELVTIGAVKLAIDMLDANEKEEFLGFVYERALEAGISSKWFEGLSCAAIFRSMNTVTRVKQLIEKEHKIKTFQFIVLETRLRTSLNNFLHKTVPEGDTGTTDYAEIVLEVNKLVEHMVNQLAAKRELNATVERYEQLTTAKGELLAKLDGMYSSSCIQWPRIKWQELPNLVDRYVMAIKQQALLQARNEALEKFIHQIENVSTQPNATQLKLEQSRLNEELKTISQKMDNSKKSYYTILNEITAKCNTMQFTLHRYEEDFCSMASGLSSSVYGKLIDCCTTCTEQILRTIPTIEDAANQFASTEEEPPTEINELNAKIQSLDLRGKCLTSRINDTKTMLEDYQRENHFSDENRLSHFTLPTRMMQETGSLLNKIVSTQKKLQQLPPGCSSTKLGSMKKKLKHLHLLEQHRTEAREMCLNNLILPIIDKLHVQKLRQVCQLVTSVSEDLPELGGNVKVVFKYEQPGPVIEDTSDYLQIPFNLHGINSINIHTINKKQRQLAYLVLYISFLYCDGCKLLLLDKAFEQLFDSGIVSLLYVLETHFPTMQVIIVDKNTQ